MENPNSSKTINILKSRRYFLIEQMYWMAVAAFWFLGYFVVLPAARYGVKHPKGGIDLLFWRAIDQPECAWMLLSTGTLFAGIALYSWSSFRIRKPILVVGQEGLIFQDTLFRFRLDWKDVASVRYRSGTIFDGLLFAFFPSRPILIEIVLDVAAQGKQPKKLLRWLMLTGKLRIAQCRYDVHPGYILEKINEHASNVQLWDEVVTN